MKKEIKGLTVNIINGKMYCTLCGMEIVNEEKWKRVHLKLHTGQ